MLPRVTTTSAAPSVTESDRKHVFHSWSAQGQISPAEVVSAQGSHFEARRRQPIPRLLEPGSSTSTSATSTPRLVAAIQEQAGRLLTVSPAFANDARSEAARLIAEPGPGDLDSVFFTNGGAEATENAMRMARLHTGRHKVLTTYRAYHGATAGAIAATGEPRRWASEPSVPGIVHFWGPYLYRSAFHATTEEEECERALQHLRDTIMVEGARRSPRSCSRRWSAPTACSSRRRATSPGCVRSATSTASSSSPTRSWPGSGGAANGSRSTVGA